MTDYETAVRTGKLPAGYQPSDEHSRVIEMLRRGAMAIYLYGRAGTGKSTFLEYLKVCDDTSDLMNHSVIVAPTGIAALNIGGSTIHRIFKIKPQDVIDTFVPKSIGGLRSLKLLIIDEISMVRADLLDMVDSVMRHSRNSDQPFGGCRVLFIGDIFQLPPVVTNQDAAYIAARYGGPWFFYATVFNDLNLELIELTKIYRQNDQDFVSVLNNIRVGHATHETVAYLNYHAHQLPEPADIDFDMHLTTTNQSADTINQTRLASLKTESFKYEAVASGDISDSDFRNCPAEHTLVIKVGARVMVVYNMLIDFDAEGNQTYSSQESVNQIYVANGQVAEVTMADADNIRIQLIGKVHGGMEFNIPRTVWEINKINFDSSEGRFKSSKSGEIMQFPIKLGWAVSIHKSQGLTLDSAKIDLGRGAFVAGQLYVALSRVRSLDGIRLTRPIQLTDVIMDSSALQYYRWKAGESAIYNSGTIAEAMPVEVGV